MMHGLIEMHSLVHQRSGLVSLSFLILVAKGFVDSVLMEVNRLDIVLIIKSMVNLMMSLMSFTVVFLVMTAVLILIMMLSDFVMTLVLMVRVIVAVFMRLWVFKVHTMDILATIMFIVRLLVL